MDLKLEGKVALVTGSSKGIGEAIVRKLAVEGATVVVHGRDAALAGQVRDDILAAGGRAHAVVGDLTRDADVAMMVQEVESVAGRIDILVNNAGGSGVAQDWSAATPQAWASAYDRNVLAALRISTAVLPGMRRAGWGRVINISSLAALMPPAHNPDYSAAKAAMLAMTASM